MSATCQSYGITDVIRLPPMDSMQLKLADDSCLRNERAIAVSQPSVRVLKPVSNAGSLHQNRRHPTRRQRLRFRKRASKAGQAMPVEQFRLLSIVQPSVASQENERFDMDQASKDISLIILHHLQDLSL